MLNFPLKRGMNFDHHVDVPGEGLAQDKYIKMIADLGFNHIRLPYVFNFDVEQFKPGPEYFERIKQVVQMVVNHGLYAMIDVHPLVGMSKDPIAMKPKLLKLWADMSEYLKDMDEKVIFEIFNEPSGLFNYEILNEIQNEVIGIIRKTNPTRLIAAACAHFNTIENLCYLKLPEDDENIFVTIHDYTPMALTHQGAPWDADPYPLGTKWGTPEEYKLLEDRYNLAAKWGKEHNRYLHLGEFGVIKLADNESRCKWTRHMIRLCEERGIAWSYWDFCFSFAVYDLKEDKWNEELLDVLTNP